MTSFMQSAPCSLATRLFKTLPFGIFALAYANAYATAPDPAMLQKMNRATVPFVVNAGQWDKRAAFAAQTFAGTVFVTTDGALVYSLPEIGRAHV